MAEEIKVEELSKLNSEDLLKKFIEGKAMIKTVKAQLCSGVVYVPKSFIGKKVMIVSE